jgi:hypothetical protein
MSLTTDLTLLKSTLSEGCLAVVQEALATVGFAGRPMGRPAWAAICATCIRRR